MDQWQLILQQRASNDLIDIDLSCDVMNNPFRHKYIIKIDFAIPANCIMTVLFPNHPVEKKRVLWTTGNLQTLSKEINERLRQSSREGLQLAVTSRDKFYRFKNVVGTVYLVWAERINMQTLNNQENTILESVPMLIELNGQYGSRNIFVFGNTELTRLHDVQLIHPFEYPIFCCEVDNRKEQVRVVSTLSNVQADLITKDPVVRTLQLHQEPAPFTTDNEDDLVLMPVTAKATNYTIKGDPAKLDEGEEEELML
jgi:hypothetical protein